MAVTAKAIAQKLGISPAAVSLALRGRPGVSEQTRSRILAAAQEMGYAFESHTRQVHSGMIQLVIYKRHGKIFSDTPFFDHLTEGVAEQASKLGFHLSISYFYGNQDAQEQLKSIRSLKSAGIVLLATEMRSSDIQLFSDLDMPIVVLDNFFPSINLDSVEIDNHYGAWNAVRYLISCKHVRIGYLHSNVEIRNFNRRYDGYLSACRTLPEDRAKDAARRVVRVGTTPDAAAKDLRAYLDKDPVLPTAFFADNDSIAAGCCRALQEYGLRIPQDISVIGFDDSSLGQLLSPQLTTMRVNKERMGALAVNRLCERLEQPLPETVCILLRPEIVVRGTVLDHNHPKALNSIL